MSIKDALQYLSNKPPHATTADFKAPHKLFVDTKANIEVLINPSVGWQAYASDTDKVGQYTSAGWVWGDIPGGSDKQIQFNDGGVFGGDADLTWDKTTNVMTVNGDIKGKAGAAAGNVGSDLDIAAGAGNTTGAGGGLYLAGGASPQGTGGKIDLSAGNGGSGDNAGGPVLIYGGAGSGTAAGGNVEIIAGDGLGTGAGGDVIIIPGAGPGVERVKITDAKFVTPDTAYVNTKANIEALASPVVGMRAVASDTGKVGFYNGSVWDWSLTNPLTANLDFAGYKAIAMACDNGATLPLAPTTGQWFLHTPTGRNVLMQYIGGAWNPIYAFSDITVYVDGLLGSDVSDNGFASGANAYQTPLFALSQLPPNGNSTYFRIILSGDCTYDTYIQNITCSIPIQLYGTYTVIDGGTITSVSGGSRTAGTKATITDTSKTWTIDEWYDYFIVVNTTGVLNGIDDIAIPIYSNTANTITTANQFGTSLGSPSGQYAIVQMNSHVTNTVSTQTNIRNVDNQSFSLKFLKLSLPTAAGALISPAVKGFISMQCCYIERTSGTLTGGNPYAQLSMSYSIVSLSGTASGFASSIFGTMTTALCLYHSSNNAQYMFKSDAPSSFSSIAGNTYIGFANVFDMNNSTLVLSSSGTNGSHYFIDCKTVFLGINSKVQDNSNIWFLTNTQKLYSVTWLFGGNTTIQKTDSDMSPVLNVQQLAKIARVDIQTAAIGETKTDVQGDGRKIYNVTHTTEGITSPSNPVIGDIWIDTN